MKLRSIALAGLLSSGVLMTSGCGTGDLTGFVGDVLQQNVVYTVNGTGGPVTFSVTGAADTLVEDQNFTANLLTGYDNYSVTYSPNGGIDPKTFPAGSTYMYTATTCDALGYLQHEIKANKVTFVNTAIYALAPADLQIVITQTDGTQHTVTETIGACGITSALSLDGVVLENDMNITVNADGLPPITETITGLDPELLAIGNNLKVDIVIFEKTILGLPAAGFTVVPMAGYDDLAAIGVGAL